MYFTDTYERAKELSRSALAAMKQRKISANPANYLIWYAYHSGNQPELKQDLDKLISQNQAFTHERNTEIYDRYFGTTVHSSALEETGRRIEAAVGQLLSLVGEAGEQTAGYGEKLVGYAGELSDTASAEDVRGVVVNILAETRNIAEQHKRLESQLIQSSREITDLRENLLNAQQESLTDALTGIANRKCFDDRLAEAVEEVRKSGEDLCLLFIDIDHFKTFNDTCGHQAGDEVLRLVARSFTDNTKGRDLPARYGGEEFAVILPQTALVHAVNLANQIRRSVEGKKIVNRSSGESMGKITLSVGVSRFRPDEGADSFIARADEALYAAKRQGRNRVVSEANLPSSLSVAS